MNMLIEQLKPKERRGSKPRQRAPRARVQPRHLPVEASCSKHVRARAVRPVLVKQQRICSATADAQLSRREVSREANQRGVVEAEAVVEAARVNVHAQPVVVDRVQRQPRRVDGEGVAQRSGAGAVERE